MLSGKDFGGRHQGGLIAVAHRYQHTEQGYECLSAADVALKQSVHLAARTHVVENFADNAFLGAGQRKWKAVAVEGVEPAPGRTEPQSVGEALAPYCMAPQIELKIEQLFEFEPFAGLLQSFGRWREVDVVESLPETDESVARNQIGRKSLEGSTHCVDYGAYPPRQLPRSYSALAQALGQRIDSAYAARGFGRCCQVDFGMYDRPLIVEHRWFAEENIFDSGVIGFFYGGCSVEPDSLQQRCAVGEEPDETPFGAFALLGEADEAAADLHRRHLFAQLSDMIKTRPVDVARRKMMEQIVVALDSEFFGKQARALGADAFKELDGYVAKPGHQNPFSR
ncbi:unknown [Prevotella sp. CAG:1031]|nr:unknown [Prevotella sp. CAG:1031]